MSPQRVLSFEARERADKARRVRVKLNLSAYTLARLLGLPERAVDQWEAYKRDPNKQNAGWLAFLETAADSARDPHRLGRKITDALINRGRSAAWFVVLSAIHYRMTPRRKDNATC